MPGLPLLEACSAMLLVNPQSVPKFGFRPDYKLGFRVYIVNKPTIRPFSENPVYSMCYIRCMYLYINCSHIPSSCTEVVKSCRNVGRHATQLASWVLTYCRRQLQVHTLWRDYVADYQRMFHQQR